MRPIQIAESVYRDRVHACWLGKNIGGTLGAPWEGDKNMHSLTFYDPVPTEAAANDDLDLQLVWLKMLQERGIYPRLSDFADYWMKHLAPYPWNEYGRCLRNLERGLRPPISGCFENYFIDEMGSPIRSEIWACIAAGDPQLAASLAWKDAVLDHAGGEGVYGEMFWAALQSAAFVISDPLTLIQIGLAMIPIHSLIARAIGEAVWCHQNGVEWQEAREHILQCFAYQRPCYAPDNHAFTIIGWLYGQDFGDCLCTAVNCGYDTDCTGATLGATLGIIGGTAAIPDKWRAPIGEDIILHPFTKDLDAPATVANLTDQTVAIGKELLGERSEVATIEDEGGVPDGLLSLLTRNQQAQAALLRDPQSTVEVVDGYEVALHYSGEPVLRPGIAKTMGISVRREGEPDRLLEVEAQIEAPAGWQVEPAPAALGQQRFRLRADEVAARNPLAVTVDLPCGQQRLEYMIFGPEEAQGWSTVQGVPTCPKCGARVDYCICAQRQTDSP